MSIEKLNLKNGADINGAYNGGLEQYHEELGASGNAEGELSTALGYNSQARGSWSHAEGGACVTSAHYAHAEGVESGALGIASHAQNQSCIASGQASHAGGFHSVASGHVATAHGCYVTANDAYQTVIGINNAQGSVGNDRALFIIGNGERDEATGDPGKQSNAFVVYRDGHAEVQKVNDTIVVEGGVQQPNNNVVTVDWVRQELNKIINEKIQILPASRFNEATAEIVILYQ